MDNLIAELYKTNKTVFSHKELSLIWQENRSNNLNSKISYYVEKGKLIRLTRGLFAKDKNYNPKELAVKIYTPSYISFETILGEAGVIFQYYESIFVATKLSKERKIHNNTFIFRKIKDEVLYNPLGIENKGNYSAATPERGFLDMIYLFPEYYFDNLDILDWDKCFEIVKIYNNKRLIKRLRKYAK